MSESSVVVKSPNLAKSALIAGILATSFLAVAPAFATGNSDQGGPAITSLDTDMNTVNTLIEDTIPLAVSCAVFGAGMQLLKRLIYA